MKILLIFSVIWSLSIQRCKHQLYSLKNSSLRFLIKDQNNLESWKKDLPDLTNFVKILKKQSIENSIQPIELALTVRSANFSFFKSFSKPLRVKQPIDMINQQVVFHYFEKHFSFKRTWLIQLWIKLRVYWKILIYLKPMSTSHNPAFKQSSWILRHQSFKINTMELEDQYHTR